jgi:hypothetical protein
VTTIYRVQGIDGRGPWRPGFSRLWITDGDRPLPPPWHEEFDAASVIRAARGDVMGCGCRSLEQLREWFMQEELTRLRSLGYFVVRMQVDRVLAESSNQVVFARHQPLAMDVETIE